MSDEFVVIETQAPHSSTEALPVYTAEATKEQSFEERIASTPELPLPILAAADIRSPGNGTTAPDVADAAALLSRDISAAFSSAVADNLDDVVASFVARGYISPDAPNQYGETPLLTAVRRGHVGMVRRLVALGAQVDSYGQSATVVYERGGRRTHFQRTPLQYAAESGHLALVKVLVEECGADDGLVAPDGALALRLAADNGHREIVDYLPVRRGGGWTRWKVKHEKQMRRIRKSFRKIGVFLYYVFLAPPKVLFWHAPNWAWENRARLGRWATKKVLGIPKALAKVPEYTWKGIKAVPKACTHAAKAVWRVICGIPKVLELIFKWVQTGIIRVCQSLANGAKKIASLVHTALSAVLSFFKRITFRDVWQGIVIASRSVFVDCPKAVAKFVVDAFEVIYKGLKILFGSLGKCVYFSAFGVIWLLIYVPKKLFDILIAMGRSIPNTFKEIMVHINPKRI
ncbi:hypothetical protein PWT90_06439 [Aphanocladium album]|nr:hypothetical protein PWT90_06439 [Aphanocladium album]